MTSTVSTRDRALAALLAQKVQLEDHLLELRSACSSDLERAALSHSYNSAADQYEAALTKGLIVNDGEVLQNVDDLKAIQQQIQDAIDQAAAIGDLLNRIASGIKIASKIVTLMA